VKAPWPDVTGVEVDALYVKGSGWDLATIEAPGFTPLPLDRMAALLEVGALSDEQMMAELSAARLSPGAPAPSVETLMHAFLPFRAVQHSHADIVLSLTNVDDGEESVRAVYGDDVVVVPYVMPGFDLAVEVKKRWAAEAHAGTVGIVLLHHGLFTFGASTRDAYEAHVRLLGRAQSWLDEHAPYAEPGLDVSPCADSVLAELADLRRLLSEKAGRPLIVTRHTGPDVRRFVSRSDLDQVTQRGPLTPDHVIRTKRVPMIGRDVDAYVEGYRAYFERHAARRPRPLEMLDPAPRVILDPEVGMLTVGETARAASIAADIYQHTIPVLERLEDRRGGYLALDQADVFDVEYWDLEQAKLRLAGPPAELAGRVAIVTGAASGIGRECARRLLDLGAAVAGFDRSSAIASMFSGDAWLGCEVDVTDVAAQADAVRETVEAFGGLDIVVVGAGVFPPSASIIELDLADWARTIDVNTTAAAALLSAAGPLLARSPVGASVVVIASRNAVAPGRGAAAYSVSKAGLTQLARVAALEWADSGVRVNVVHPDNVFDTGLWTDELIAARAAAYGMTSDQYMRRNLLGVDVTAAQIATAVALFAGDQLAATTAAQLPVDGGNERTV